ncbi:hypothetical protein LC607_34245 [Nostoc sp. CHAB 5824]|nr:hypothetical protein [Nostoc sp. CHAB 5844]MCC5647879.1 hypothetical protein [Nostoc sp. CHAB 5824]
MLPLASAAIADGTECGQSLSTATSLAETGISASPLTSIACATGIAMADMPVMGMAP